MKKRFTEEQIIGFLREANAISALGSPRNFASRANMEPPMLNE
ncbi:hypothetical protein [Chromobacterium phragmitis]|uniref:Transposase n=1 Tax=Chromobacterium phragmitis TaxID=2202141 RepID=A0ABV0IX52_9NEIS